MVFVFASDPWQIDLFCFVLFSLHCSQDADGKEVAITSDEKVG